MHLLCRNEGEILVEIHWGSRRSQDPHGNENGWIFCPGSRSPWAMNPVAYCPRCHGAMGDFSDPVPDSLPSCSRCGWVSTGPARSGVSWVFLALIPAWFIGGLLAGAITGYSLFWAPVLLLLFGPVGAFQIARRFSEGWLVFTAAAMAGLAVGLMLPGDGQTFGPGSARFLLAVCLGSLLFGWFVGWLKHS